MKVVIIGGGIAGLSMAIYLRRHDIHTIVCERDENIPSNGNAFMMHSEGVMVLKALTQGQYSSKVFPGSYIDQFSLRRPNDVEVKFQKMEPWQCIKRKDIVEYLYDFYPPTGVKFGCKFSHFEYEGEKAVAAVFENGTKEYGDVFIGADGGRSKVREQIFGPTRYTPTKVKEVLGIYRSKAICDMLRGQFTKYQHPEKGIAIGMIPSTDDELVWYMQYDVRIADIDDDFTPEQLKHFCKNMLKAFPAHVQQVIDGNDFQCSYIWHTCDFDVLPSFHQSNMVLIGDAAHLALPFSSAGTTNALVDAYTLTRHLLEQEIPAQAFIKFYDERAAEIAAQIQLGRDILQDFLHPNLKSDDELVIPLITKQRGVREITRVEKQVRLLYFTDPICSTCWVIQPQLRKLQLEYSPYIHVEYKMAGLLPSWENFDRYGIRQPADVAAHWEEVCAFYEMPINKNIWLEDPLPSSFPPSIAFKAAQLQDTGKAILFLRRIREMVFVENKNIINKTFLYRAAFDVGLDAARLLRDLEGKAQMLFREDLQLAEQMQVNMLPTLFFTDAAGEMIRITGFHQYEDFEAMLLQLIPTAKKMSYDVSPKALFNKFQTFTSKEFSYLRNEDIAVSDQVLQNLFENNYITSFQSPTGNIWINNFHAVEEQ